MREKNKRNATVKPDQGLTNTGETDGREDKHESKYHQNVTIKLLLCQFNQTMNHNEQIR